MNPRDTEIDWSTINTIDVNEILYDHDTRDFPEDIAMKEFIDYNIYDLFYKLYLFIIYIFRIKDNED